MSLCGFIWFQPDVDHSGEVVFEEDLCKPFIGMNHILRLGSILKGGIQACKDDPCDGRLSKIGKGVNLGTMGMEVAGFPMNLSLLRISF